MKKVYKDRLLKLADFLENKVPRKHFDLNYITHDNTHVIHQAAIVLTNKLKKISKDLKEHTCGAVACAIGWMPAVFPRTIMWHDDYILFRKDKEGVTNVCANGTLRFKRTDFGVAETFLGINSDQSSYLFVPNYYPKNRRGPKSVAKKIRTFVETGTLAKKMYDD